MATCPKCGAELKAWSIRGSFKCVSCSAQLKGHIVWPLVTTLILWQLADFFIYPLVHFMAGTDLTAVTIRSAVSACVGFPLYIFLVGNFSAVEVASEPGSAT
jgi:hypothetical protein